MILRRSTKWYIAKAQLIDNLLFMLIYTEHWTLNIVCKRLYRMALISLNRRRFISHERWSCRIKLLLFSFPLFRFPFTFFVYGTWEKGYTICTLCTNPYNFNWLLLNDQSKLGTEKPSFHYSYSNFTYICVVTKKNGAKMYTIFEHVFSPD